jgi:hypothetical protein
VGGQQDLPNGGQQKLPAHGHLVTQRAVVSSPTLSPEPSSTGTLVMRFETSPAHVLGQSRLRRRLAPTKAMRSLRLSFYACSAEHGSVVRCSPARQRRRLATACR